MEKRFIVTIGREFGTGGRKIANELAEMLDVQLYDRQVLEPIREEYNLTQEEVDQIKAVKPSWWYDNVSQDLYDEERIAASTRRRYSWQYYQSNRNRELLPPRPDTKVHDRLSDDPVEPSPNTHWLLNDSLPTMLGNPRDHLYPRCFGTSAYICVM